MELREISIEYNQTDPIYICGLGDIHYGNVACDLEALNRAIKFILDKNAYVVLMGDLIDAINPKDKRFDIKTVSPHLRDKIDNLVSEQYYGLKEYISKIPPERIIGVHTGNHEDKVRVHESRDITYDLCRDMGLKYLGYSAWTRLRFTRNGNHTEVFKMFTTHGFGGARFPATKQWKVHHTIHNLDDVDLVMMGHQHDLQVGRIHKQTINTVGEMRPVYKTVGWCLTGGFLRTDEIGVSTYSEKMGYGQLKAGIGTFVIYPEGRRIHATL